MKAPFPLLLMLVLLLSCASTDFPVASSGGDSTPAAAKQDSTEKPKSKKELEKEKKEQEKEKKRQEEKQKFDAISGSAIRILGGVAPISAESERAIGGGIAIKSFETQGSLHADEALQRYVASVGRSVARATPRSQDPFSFAVVDSDDVNAWSAPGGYIFITTGTLRQMEDESQLAGVLAHEIAHVTQGHMMTMIRRSETLTGLSQGVAALTDADVGKYSRAVDAGTDIVFNRGLDRNMEYEADLAGLDYAALTGYDPRGLPRFLEKLRGSQQRQGWLGSTHPALQDRLARMNQKLNIQLKGVEGATQKERFQAVVGKALNPT